MPRAPRDTEVDAYVFIKNTLRELAWDVRNPERIAAGQVWTQNECLSNPALKEQLGLERPENIIKVTDAVLWVVEAKRSRRQIEQALSEAEGYAKAINRGRAHKAKFISGVAGNETDGYLIRSKFLVGNTYKPIRFNGVETTGLLSLSLSAASSSNRGPLTWTTHRLTTNSSCLSPTTSTRFCTLAR